LNKQGQQDRTNCRGNHQVTDAETKFLEIVERIRIDMLFGSNEFIDIDPVFDLPDFALRTLALVLQDFWIDRF